MAIIKAETARKENHLSCAEKIELLKALISVYDPLNGDVFKVEKKIDFLITNLLDCIGGIKTV